MHVSNPTVSWHHFIQTLTPMVREGGKGGRENVKVERERGEKGEIMGGSEREKERGRKGERSGARIGERDHV